MGTIGHFTDMPTKSLVTHNGQPRWKVEWGRQNGKRPRNFYETEREADKEIADWGKKVKAAGQWWATLEENEQLGIQVVVGKIKEAGLELDRVWAEHQQWKADRELPSNANITPMGYEDVVSEWATRKKGAEKDERYIYNAKADLMRFALGQEKRPIHEFRPEELSKWMSAQTVRKKGPDFGKPWGKSTKRTWMSLFHGLWDVAVKMGWASVNIVDRLEPIGKPSREKKYYPNDTVRNILAAHMQNEITQSCLLVPVLGFFGCMRPEEIQNDKPRRNEFPPEKWFGWKDIDLKHKQIHVSKDVAKTGDERVIDLQPNAVKWLQLCKKLECPLPLVNNFRISDLTWELIGMAAEARIRDGFRKNCATHLRPVVRDDYAVVSNMGNSIRTLLKAYAALKVPEPISRAYWTLDPDSIEAFMKTREWEKILREGAKRAAEWHAGEQKEVEEAEESEG